MAAPTPAAAGVAATAVGGGPVSPAWPAGHASGQVALMAVVSSAEAFTLTDAQGFAELPSSPQSRGSAGGTSAINLALYWCRATSGAMPAPSVQSAGDFVYARIVTFDGCIPTGNPWDITLGTTLGTTGTADVPGGTTSVDDCLIVSVVADSFDTTLDKLSGWANADLTGVAEFAEGHTNNGTGGGFAVATGVKASRGAFGDTTATVNGTSQLAEIMVALKPPVAAGQMQADAAAIAEACGVAFVGAIQMPQIAAASGLALVGARAFTGSILTPPVLRKHKRRRIAAALAAGNLRRSS